MIYMQSPEVSLRDDTVVFNDRPTLHLDIPGGDLDDAQLITDIEADALLRALLRWKLKNHGGGEVSAAVAGAHGWARELAAELEKELKGRAP